MSVAVPENTPAVDKTTHPVSIGVIYCRVARNVDPSGLTEQCEIAEQRKTTRCIAAELNVPIVEEFIDVGISGTITDRPELRRMLDLAYAGRITHCIVDHRYRLARTFADTIAIEWELKQHGVCIVVAAESSDTVRSIIDALTAKEERQQLVAHTDQR